MFPSFEEAYYPLELCIFISRKFRKCSTACVTVLIP